MTKKLPEKFTNIYPRDPDASSQEKINGIIDYLTPEAPTEEVKGDWIDYLYDRHFKEDTRREKKGLRNQIESAMDICQSKPVEQELILLPNLHELAKEIEANLTLNNNPYGTSVIYIVIKSILSKYGVHKQEEDEGITLEEAEEQIKQCTGIDKQQGTACIKCGWGIKTYLDGTCIDCHPKNKTAFEKSITPTPQATSVDVDKKWFLQNPKAIENMELKPIIDVEEVVDKIFYLFEGIKSKGDYRVRDLETILSSLPIVQKKRSKEEIMKRVMYKQNTGSASIYNFCKEHNLLSD